MSLPNKRSKLEESTESTLRSLNRDVSPPTTTLRQKSTSAGPSKSKATELNEDVDSSPSKAASSPKKPRSPRRKPVTNAAQNTDTVAAATPAAPVPEMQQSCISSPFRLTRIRELDTEYNRDTVHLREILGDVMLNEVWIFNYMHDIPWVMSQFDPDIRDHVKVTFLHGNWKREDPSRLRMAEEAAQFKNVRVVVAHMPEMFGTHHTKLMVLFRRDDTAQVIVHTANMIQFDWGNMTQAAWLSPWLPLLSSSPPPSTSPVGERFKSDLLAYFKHYGRSRTGALTDELQRYGFSAVRAIFISSVPGRHPVSTTTFGHPYLARVLRTIPTPPAPRPRIFAQCSSIATLGQSDTWLSPVFFQALAQSSTPEAQQPEKGIIFPTVEEVRTSLNGYRSGSSIHIRATSAAQQKQLAYLRPLLHHWGADPDKAGRSEAAPHIKTYMRFRDKEDNPGLDWALLTSANLSTQAWGAAEKEGSVGVCSYEAGVLVHPGLWGEGVEMKGVYRQDDVPEALREGKKVVALRMPYSYPPDNYWKEDRIWVAAGNYEEPDVTGAMWID